ncbi:MAG: aminodeoxychorismate/anthranilate synthase component II [Alphaproteobacteria bacterium]|nr:aminodeoxychorismate/anthranilate synthase component II [Alphaproteobacteria bacterium]MCK5658960.1 aminodeoxychorismate/anthranilate synthase component II [Alphaproteobacteria bacterium]
MILLVDNYDSFVYNLSRYTGQLGRQRQVMRNDDISLVELINNPPKAIILSPGPCTPTESGICLSLIREFHQVIPILGVCLGHQCIGEAFGGRTVRSAKPVHGKASLIDHNGEGLFQGLPQLFRGGRYHSLVTELPADAPIKVTARVQGQGIIMAIKHKQYPVYGLQFHPESILTEHGIDLLRNFFSIADEWNAKRRRKA